jgi:hypothetical protein
VLDFEPGEYHIVELGCSNDRQSMAIGGQGETPFVGGPVYKYSYASFRVTPAKMLDIGYFLVHVQGDRISRIEIAPMSAQTREALRRSYPEEYARLETARLTAAPITDPQMAAVQYGEVSGGGSIYVPAIRSR